MRPFSAAAFREKSHIHSSDSKGSLTSLRQLKKFPGYPSPLERNTEGPATSRRPPFSLPHPELGVPFPASSGKESRNSRRTSRGGGLNLKFEKNSRGRATVQKTMMSQSTPDPPDTPASDLTVTPRIDSEHYGSCDNPVAPREEATDTYVNSTGGLTLLLQLWR